MEYRDQIILRYPILHRIRRRLYCLLGKIIDNPDKFFFVNIIKSFIPSISDRLHLYYLTKKEYEDYYKSYKENDRLTEEQIADITNYQPTVYLKPRKQYFEKSKMTIQHLVIPMLDSILRSDKKIKSILNVGCRYAYIDYIMAGKYQNIRFNCVDFGNVEKFNSDLKRDNIHYIGGYALDLLEKGEIMGDIVYFSSTSVLINNKELRRYLRIISKKAKYLVFNEPILYSLNGKIYNLDKILIDNQISVSDKCLLHNFRGLVEEAGFKVLHYYIFPFSRGIKHEDLHMVNCIAINTKIFDD